MRYSSLVNRVAGDTADVWDLHYEANHAAQSGEDVIVLSVGDPDFDTPAAIIEKAHEAMRQGDTHYTSIQGYAPLRQAIAEGHTERTGQAVTADHVITTSGAQNALFACCMTLFEAGDEVIVLQPMYVTYEATVQAPGATLVPVVLRAEDDFRLDANRLREAITPKTRGIMYSSPNNPTGVMLHQQELEVIAELARAHELWIIADEVYSDFVFDEKSQHLASLPELDDRCITIGSMSKSYAMSGWRLGWIVGPRELLAHINKLCLCMLYGLPGFVSQAALHALKHCRDEMLSMKAIYRRRRDFLFEQFSSMPLVQPLLPDAGMFLMLKISDTGLTSSQFVSELYRATGVSVLDASVFGASANGYVRVSYTPSDEQLEEACRRVQSFLQQRNE